MTYTDADRLGKLRAAIASNKTGVREMRAEIADLLLDDGWLSSTELERILNAQARAWVWGQMETVLIHCEENDAYTIPGTVAALREHLLRLLTAQSLGGSSSEMTNAQDRAKALALQTIITTGPLAY